MDFIRSISSSTFVTTTVPAAMRSVADSRFATVIASTFRGLGSSLSANRYAVGLSLGTAAFLAVAALALRVAASRSQTAPLAGTTGSAEATLSQQFLDWAQAFAEANLHVNPRAIPFGYIKDQEGKLGFENIEVIGFFNLANATFALSDRDHQLTETAKIQLDRSKRVDSLE